MDVQVRTWFINVVHNQKFLPSKLPVDVCDSVHFNRTWDISALLNVYYIDQAHWPRWLPQNLLLLSYVTLVWRSMHAIYSHTIKIYNRNVYFNFVSATLISLNVHIDQVHYSDRLSQNLIFLTQQSDEIMLRSPPSEMHDLPADGGYHLMRLGRPPQF